MRAALAISCLSLGLALCACGQAGDLYLPEKAAEPVKSEAPAPSGPADAAAPAQQKPDENPEAEQKKN